MTDPALPARKPRHDAFDGGRRRRFLEALGKSGCLRDAARVAGVSHQTIYNHQARDRAFARQCDLALGMAGTDIELHAWERGVVGIEEPIVYRGEVIGVRVKRSDAILRLLLQGAKRKKYGANPGFSRKRLMKAERQRIEREVRAELYEKARARAATPEETDRAIMAQLAVLGARHDRERLAAGWTRVGEDWIPPGWVRDQSLAPTGQPGDDDAEQSGDSV